MKRVSFALTTFGSHELLVPPALSRGLNHRHAE